MVDMPLNKENELDKKENQKHGFGSLRTFFELLSLSLSPCLSQRFSRCTLRPSSGGCNVELIPPGTVDKGVGYIQ